MSPIAHRKRLSISESDTFSRQCCKSQRGFVMHITDNANQVRSKTTKHAQIQKALSDGGGGGGGVQL